MRCVGARPDVPRRTAAARVPLSCDRGCQLLHVIRSHANVCCHLHLPVQSGSTSVLERMRRGYTREAYLDLVDRVRDALPTVTLSSDFIVGFCGETDAEHRETISLVERVGYHQAFMFAYSMREKTHAHRRMQDDVPDEVKRQRLAELVEVFHAHARTLYAREIGRRHLVLVERVRGAAAPSLSTPHFVVTVTGLSGPRARRLDAQPSKRNPRELVGRTDGNVKVIIGATADGEAPPHAHAYVPRIGDYAEVEIESATSASLRGRPIRLSSIADFARGSAQQCPDARGAAVLHSGQCAVAATAAP